MPMTPAERVLRGKLAAYESWSRTEDPSARTAPARKAFADRFAHQVDPEGRLTVAERQRRAEAAKRAYYTRLALASAKARRLKAGK